MKSSRKRKPACKRGHVNPPRYKHGACIPCSEMYRKENYQRDRERKIKYAIERAKINPEARRDEQRACRLKVPVAEVRYAIARCGGKCEACEQPLIHKLMCVDHDHATGRIRGILCRFCNGLEGMLNKKANRVTQVRAYVVMATARAGVLKVLKAAA